jgi:hypothetical protein
MTTFKQGTPFQGTSQLAVGEEGYSSVTLAFTVQPDYTGGIPAGATPVTPQMAAAALNDLFVDNGWPSATFYGAPVDEPLV